jgi:hypothetical protein
MAKDNKVPVQKRTASCKYGYYPYKYCEGGDADKMYKTGTYANQYWSKSETKTCNDKRCAINGKWTAWSKYTFEPTCGYAKGTRTRECTNPAPQFGGKDCYGSATYTYARMWSGKYC